MELPSFPLHSCLAIGSVWILPNVQFLGGGRLASVCTAEPLDVFCHRNDLGRSKKRKDGAKKQKLNLTADEELLQQEPWLLPYLEKARRGAGGKQVDPPVCPPIDNAPPLHGGENDDEESQILLDEH